MAISWLGEEPDPFWERELHARLECIVHCVSASPSCLASYSDERAQLCTASKCSFVDKEQSGWGV